MSTTDNAQRKDPLIDAYRQASDREGARPGADVRAAVLAHARVVAQSLPSANASTVAASDTNRNTVAANEPRPIWRLAAGVVIGLVGVWIFQLTRPVDAPDTTVASVSAPQVAKSRVADSVAAAGPSAATAPAAAAAQPEVAVAVLAPKPAAPSTAVDSSVSRARMDGGNSRKPTEVTRAEASVAVATAAPPAAVERAAAAPPSATAAVAAANGEPLRETVVASAELRKSANVASSPFKKDQAEMTATAPLGRSAAPNAFPAQSTETAIAAAPAPAPTPALARASPPPASVAPPITMATAPSAAVAGGALTARNATAPSDKMKVAPQSATQNDAIRSVSQLSEVDRAMFRAVRAGELVALRAAIGRGANVNARDELGRTPLQIARERDDTALSEALQAAGAR